MHIPHLVVCGRKLSKAHEAAAPVGEEEFCALMEACAPFEPRPHIAVAVSGGADSMALCFLLHNWRRAGKARLTALCVDHGLRPEAPHEAALTLRRLHALGVEGRLLSGRTAKPSRTEPPRAEPSRTEPPRTEPPRAEPSRTEPSRTEPPRAEPSAKPANAQSLARALRYRLLEAWCRQHAVLHLALAHHADDQGETLLLRLARGSGVYGLSAMARVRASAHLRLLRPLLSLRRDRLRATLTRAGLAWVEDASNHDTRYGRVRLRKAAPVLAAEGASIPRLAATAARMGRARDALAQMAAHAAARSLTLSPLGYARLDADALGRFPAEAALRVVAGTLRSVSGRMTVPRMTAVERLWRVMTEPSPQRGKASTLHGCLVLPWGPTLDICR